MSDTKTLRDEFAMAALQGFIANTGDDGPITFKGYAHDAYKQADAMLAERGKSGMLTEVPTFPPVRNSDGK